MRPLFLKEYLFFIRIATSCLILKTLFANLAIVCHLDPTLSKCYNEGCYLGVLKMLIATVLTTSATTFSLRTIAFCYGGCSKNWISSRSVFLLTSFSVRYSMHSPETFSSKVWNLWGWDTIFNISRKTK